MKIVLKQNVANIVACAICIVVSPIFIIMVWVTDATLGERLLITAMFTAFEVLGILELFKAINWRIVAQEDEFIFRNRWGREHLYSYSDIVSITVKSRYYVINLQDDSITVEYRSVNNCMYFLDEAAYHGVEIDEKM